jgi:hypothetical protein
VHPFRFGVQLSKAKSPREWRELARKVEELEAFAPVVERLAGAD